jgi:hypothetical protein
LIIRTYNRESRKSFFKSPDFFKKIGDHKVRGLVTFMKTRLKDTLDGMNQQNIVPEITKSPRIIASQNVLSRIVPLWNSNPWVVRLSSPSLPEKKPALILQHKRTIIQPAASQSWLTLYPLSLRNHSEVTNKYLQSAWQEIILDIQDVDSLEAIRWLVSGRFLSIIRSIEDEESRAYKKPVQIIWDQWISLTITIHPDSYAKYENILPEIERYASANISNVISSPSPQGIVSFSVYNKDFMQVSIHCHAWKDFHVSPIWWEESYHTILKKGLERMVGAVSKKIEQIELETAGKFIHEKIGVYDTESYHDYIDIIRQGWQRFCEYFLSIHPDCTSMKSFWYTVEQGVLRTIGDRLKKINPKRVFLADRYSVVFLEIATENMKNEVLNIVNRFNTNGHHIELKTRENPGKI